MVSCLGRLSGTTLEHLEAAPFSLRSGEAGPTNATASTLTLDPTAQKAAKNSAQDNDLILAQETRQKSAILPRPSPDIRGGTCSVVF